MSQSYRVVVTRGVDGSWLADVPALTGAHTFAHTRQELDRSVREVVVLAAGLPDSAMPDLDLVWEFDGGRFPDPFPTDTTIEDVDLDQTVVIAGGERLTEARAEQLAEQTIDELRRRS